MARPLDELDVVRGPARVDTRTKDLAKRLRPGDVAIIDHLDLDRVAAEALLEARPAAVVNAAASISGRYPNLGPLLITAAGIPLVDGVGPEVMEAVKEGDKVTVRGGAVVAGTWTGNGDRQSIATLEEQIEAAKASMGGELERFAANTLEYMQREQHLLLDEPEVPDVGVDMRGRHVLVVVRGHDYKDDLAALRQGGYLADMRPVLIAVDGAADALLEIGRRPDIIIGDMDSVSERALRCGAVVVVHAYRGGEAPGAARLVDLGVEHLLYEAPGTSEDIAMLLAYENGAKLIVAVGTHSSMVDFLDKGRAGMASTFLVRLKVGPILVDAKGVNKLYDGRVRKRDVFLLVGSAVAALVAVTAISQPARLFLEQLWLLAR
ncbi:MAG TPA: putative cytokinetic ring protein SteA [Acidimicrobiales bacterium]|nr:putative cytokinetic ring protein SteA [Acidimicrobiales bacterium]